MPFADRRADTVGTRPDGAANTCADRQRGARPPARRVAPVPVQTPEGGGHGPAERGGANLSTPSLAAFQRESTPETAEPRVQPRVWHTRDPLGPSPVSLCCGRGSGVSVGRGSCTGVPAGKGDRARAHTPGAADPKGPSRSGYTTPEHAARAEGSFRGAAPVGLPAQRGGFGRRSARGSPDPALPGAGRPALVWHRKTDHPMPDRSPCQGSPAAYCWVGVPARRLAQAPAEPVCRAAPALSAPTRDPVKGTVGRGS